MAINLESQSENGKVLMIRFNRSNVELHSEFEGEFEFSKDEFDEIKRSIIDGANNIWKNLNPRIADSFSSDYDEWYDKEVGNEANLVLVPKIHTIKIIPPFGRKTTRLYRFNKRTMESFIFDLNKEGKADD